MLNLFKQWGGEAVIIDSELLTDLASAPQDTQENREQLITVTLGVGVLIGIFVMSVAQIALTPWNYYLNQQHLLMVAGTLFGIGVLVWMLSKTKKKGRSQKMADTMEKITNIVSK